MPCLLCPKRGSAKLQAPPFNPSETTSLSASVLWLPTFPLEKHLRFIRGRLTRMEQIEREVGPSGPSSWRFFFFLLAANLGADPTPFNPQKTPSVRTAVVSTYQILLASLLPGQF